MKLFTLSVLGALLLLPAETICSEEKAKQDSGTGWEKYLCVALKSGAVTVAIVGGTAVIVPAIGFTSTGVALGSLAAWWQSLYGGTIVSGSLFAILQKIGVVGLGAGAKGSILTGSALVVWIQENC